ncbi:MAG: IPT/TIG domain-containing protein [Methanoregula sp.]|nr:IPT/TIG domain-containing protein [Methanoregula sp.]
MSAAGISEGTRGQKKRTVPFNRVSCILVIVILSASVGLVSAVSVPVIYSISPSGGPLAGGTPVTITGSGFTGTTDVRFGEISGTGLNIFNDTQLTITTPPHDAASVFISITTPAGTGMSPDPATMYNYEEFPLPRLSGISPDSGPMNGGTVVTITGSGFSGTEYVYFGKYGVIPTITDDSHLRVTTLYSPPGLVPVSIKNAHGTGSSAGPSTMFLVEYPLPDLYNISPTSGFTTGGTVVLVRGSGFSGATNVSFGRNNGTGLEVINDTLLTVISPPGPAGIAALSVINPAHAGSSSESRSMFRYDIPFPRLENISPSSGSMDGGTVVTLTGSGFTGTTDVVFGEKPGTGLKVINDNQLTIITPASALGSFPLTITNAYGKGGSSGSSTSFQYVIAPDTTTTATGTVTPTRNESYAGEISPAESFPVTSPAQAAPAATAASTTKRTPGFGAVAGLSVLGAIILLRKTAP